MRVNADFSRFVILRPEDRDWIRSPQAGVDRQMLDRIGDEVARATSIVRYIPGSEFNAHRHDLGEEFLVLDGIFADEHDRYPAGTYIRNPPGTSHRPDVPDGCTIFVKLRQFDPQDLTQKAVHLSTATWQGAADGRRTLPLHTYGNETVSAEELPAAITLDRQFSGGSEILILKGALVREEEVLPMGTWIRVPDGGRLTVAAGPDGVQFWMKTGHLPPSEPI